MSDTLPPLMRDEYQARVQRAQETMALQGMGALLITTEMNFQ